MQKTSPQPLTVQKILNNAQTVVIKIGSSLLVEPEGQLHSSWLNQLAADIAELTAKKKKILLVSSGAVALGRARLNLPTPLKLDDKQAAAATGQADLMSAWQNAFQPHGVTVAQLLLTLETTHNRRSYLNARATLQKLLSLGVVPVVNENDTIATAELRYGDNDRLSAHVAQLARAELLVLFSDVDGLFTADPNRDKAATLVPHVAQITSAIEQMAGTAPGSAIGTGGMATKIAAARIASAAGVTTLIANGRTSSLKNLGTEHPCTIFAAAKSPERARRQWINAQLVADGKLIIDDGASRALATGASLLPAGICRVEGSFDKGDTVHICHHDGTKLATGLVAYSASEITLLAGGKSQDIAIRLGYQGRPAIIHRDDLVLLTRGADE